MANIKYLFISRVSSHYRYYQKLVAFIGESSRLEKIKMLTLPRFKHLKSASKLDLDELVNVHVARKKVRHPILFGNSITFALLKSAYKLIEVCRASYYFSYFSSHQIENLIIWNGQKQPNKTPYTVAKVLGINTHLFENGLLPKTTVLDPKGVNALNSLPRDAEFYKSWQPQELNLSQQLEVRENHKHRQSEGSQTALPQKYVFVPFQVPNDTQIICHSPWIQSMEDFYGVLENALAALPQDVLFVVKEHPTWPRSFSKLHHKNSRILFANDNNTQQLIEQAQAVVTINSTVGIESLLLEKQVITLGNTFLNIPGLVHHCDDISQFRSTLYNLEQLSNDAELRTKFLGYLQQEYLIAQRWDQLEQPEQHFQQVLDRLNNPYRVS